MPDEDDEPTRGTPRRRSRPPRLGTPADRREDTKRRQRRKLAFRIALDAAARTGLGVMGAFRTGDPGRPGTLAGDFVAAVAAKTPMARDKALIALARHPQLVSTYVAVPAVRHAVVELDSSEAGQRVRTAVFPLVTRWALRLGWADVQEAARTDDRLHDAHAFAQRLHERAMLHVVTLLGTIAVDPEPFARLVDAPALRPADREYGLAVALVAALERSWRKRLTIMLGRLPNTLRQRKWRLKKVTLST